MLYSKHTSWLTRSGFEHGGLILYDFKLDITNIRNESHGVGLPSAGAFNCSLPKIERKKNTAEKPKTWQYRVLFCDEEYIIAICIV